MAFNYVTPVTQQALTPTYDSKVVLAKSFKIDVVAGSGSATGVTYTLGMLPKGAQVISQAMNVNPAISGGGISASTITVAVGGQNIMSAINVFAATVTSGAGTNAYISNLSSTLTKDAAVTYTFTHTNGTQPTAGTIWITLGYVV